MTTEKLVSNMRYLIGNVSVNEVPDRELIEGFLVPSLIWYVGEVRLEHFTDNELALVANQAEYPIPRGLSWLVFVELNNQLLTPTSTYAMNLFNGDWRATPAGTPIQYAIEGRSLILNPAPSAAVVAQTPFFAWRYIGTGNEIDASGTPELSDLDQQLIRYNAAIGWLAAHPEPQNQARIVEYEKIIARLLPPAQQRWENALQSWFPSLSPNTTGRQFAAR